MLTPSASTCSCPSRTLVLVTSKWKSRRAICDLHFILRPHIFALLQLSQSQQNEMRKRATKPSVECKESTKKFEKTNNRTKRNSTSSTMITTRRRQTPRHPLHLVASSLAIPPHRCPEPGRRRPSFSARRSDRLRLTLQSARPMTVERGYLVEILQR